MPDTSTSTETQHTADPAGTPAPSTASDGGPGPRLARAAPWRRLSHELGTPLHAILGHAELLLEGSFGPLGGEARACISEIQGAGRQLALELRRLLLIVEASGAPGRGDEAIDCEAMFRTAFANRPVQVSWRGGPLVVWGERFWLRTMADAIADALAGDGRGRIELVAHVGPGASDLEVSRADHALVEGELDAIAQALIEVLARRHGAEALWLPEGLRIRGLRVRPDGPRAAETVAE